MYLNITLDRINSELKLPNLPSLNTWKAEINSHHLADNIFEGILQLKIVIFIEILLTFAKGPVDNQSPLAQVVKPVRLLGFDCDLESFGFKIVSCRNEPFNWN